MRQLTEEYEIAQIQELSKLPMRQLTRLKITLIICRFSKLPMRQLTYFPYDYQAQ